MLLLKFETWLKVEVFQNLKKYIFLDFVHRDILFPYTELTNKIIAVVAKIAAISAFVAIVVIATTVAFVKKIFGGYY